MTTPRRPRRGPFPAAEAMGLLGRPMTLDEARNRPGRLTRSDAHHASQEADPMSDIVPTTTEPQEASQALAEAPTLNLADVMTPEAIAALERAGINPELLRAPKPPEVTTISLKDLMVVKSDYPRALGQTRPLVYVSHRVDPESTEYEGYKGVLYVEAVEPQTGPIVITHAYAREDGELMPLSAWVEGLSRGDVFTVAMIETRSHRTVYRPIDPAGYPSE